MLVVVLLLPLASSMDHGDAVDKAGGGCGGGGRWRLGSIVAVGGRSMATTAFIGSGDGLWISNGEVKMAIDTSGGRWRQRASVFNGGNG